jgi:hypothetical protein
MRSRSMPASSRHRFHPHPIYPPKSTLISMCSRGVCFLRNHLPEGALNLINLLISGTACAVVVCAFFAITCRRGL